MARLLVGNSCERRNRRLIRMLSEMSCFQPQIVVQLLRGALQQEGTTKRTEKEQKKKKEKSRHPNFRWRVVVKLSEQRNNQDQTTHYSQSQWPVTREDGLIATVARLATHDTICD